MTRTHHFNERAFEKLNEESAYWLGFIAADGYILDQPRASGTVCYVLRLNLSDKDVTHLNKFVEFMGSGKSPVSYTSGTVSSAFWSKALVQDLKTYLPSCRKSDRLDLPDLPESLEGHFIRGFFDGDGWASKAGPTSMNVGMVSNGPIIDSILSRLKEKGITFRIEEDKRSNARTVCTSSRLEIIKFYDFCNGDNPLRLDRKWSKIEGRISTPTEEDLRRERGSVARNMILLGASNDEIIAATTLKRKSIQIMRRKMIL